MKIDRNNQASVGWLLFCGLFGFLFAFIFIFFGSDTAGQAAPMQAESTPALTEVGTQIKGAVAGEPVSPADTTGMPLAEPATNWQGASPYPVLELGRPPKFTDQSIESEFVDPVLQSQMLNPSNMPDTLTNWEGIPSNGVFPPDTNGQVGPNHYVQIVNAPYVGSSVRIWDKEGNQLYDFGLNNLWPSGVCSAYGYGDPVVLYDQLADRWLLTQFTVNAPSYYECIAVSKTGTPTNNPNDWWLYAFNIHSTKFNDYPKLGVWPDGYYMSANQFTDGSYWGGAGVWVFERDKMLDGLNPSFQYFDLGSTNSNYGALLPSNLMGDTLPPAGAPNYFMSVDMDWTFDDKDILHIWEFHTDWDNSNNSTFTLVQDLEVAPFSWNFSGTSGAEVPQPDTAQGLDNLSDRLMMHLWYRNFGSHESIVVNHTVNVGSNNNDLHGIRWYEIRGGTVDTTLADASIYQQGTFSPDSEHRWMGSIAMDHVGNIALGYSVSSESVYPSIRYAGRLRNDPLDVLSQGEGLIITGSGSQTDYDYYGRGRWGDYSAMSVDPVDDCTFWYTTEYVETTGPRTWKTQVASFKFPNCVNQPLGTLQGKVSDANSSAALADVTVHASTSITQTYQTDSNVDGNYIFDVPIGTYTLTAATYGYYSATVTGLTVETNTITTQNMQLTPRPTAVISGTITDDTTGWPLYARLFISTDGFEETIFTDPISGTYSITLYQDLEYDFQVSAISSGYDSVARAVTPGVGGQTEDFNLSPNLSTCNAPGYDFVNLVCEPTADGLIVGNIYRLAGGALNEATITDELGNQASSFTTPDDPNIADGFYILGSEAGTQILTASKNRYGDDIHQVTVVIGEAIWQDFWLPEGNIIATPSSVSAEVELNSVVTKTLVLTNTGTYTAAFELTNINAIASTPTAGISFIPTRRVSPKHPYDLNASSFSSYNPPVAPKLSAGTVLHTYSTSLSGLWGLAVDALEEKIWLGDTAEGGGVDALQRYNLDGTPTSTSLDLSGVPESFGADITTDPFTGLLWQVNVGGGKNCIYAIDPNVAGPTGEEICPAINISQRGIAYDLTTNTFYLGSWNDGSIHHIDVAGNILDSKNVNLNISGLAFNPATNHLFVLSNAAVGFDIYVLDVNTDYNILGGFDIPGLNDFEQGGLGLDCDGNLWIANQESNSLIVAESGEYGICAWTEIPWLNANPLNGSLPPGKGQVIDLTLDATDLAPGLYQAMLRVNNDTPDGTFYIPINMTVPALASLSINPSSASISDFAGGTITYTLQITNVGNIPDSFNISIDSAWTTNYPAETSTINPGESQEINIHVTIPSTAKAGDFDIATVTVQSASDPDKKQTARLTTTAKGANIYLPFITSD